MNRVRERVKYTSFFGTGFKKDSGFRALKFPNLPSISLEE